MPVRLQKIPSMSVVVKKEDRLAACEERCGVVDYCQSHLHEHHEHEYMAKNPPPPQQYQDHNMHPLAPPTKKSKYNAYHYDTSVRHPDGPSQHYLYASENAGTPPTFFAPETVRSSPYLDMPQFTSPAHTTPPPPPPPPKPQHKSAKPGSSDQPDSVTGSTNPYSTSRGLRHFSMKVCEKVEEKGTTTYNEVANELVRELKLAEMAIEAKALENGKAVKKCKVITCEKVKKNHDDKNIRRRVYDALNVLMAMEIITKNKKEITWRGLPGSIDQATCGVHGSANGEAKKGVDGLSQSQRVQQLRIEVKKRKEIIRKKMECLQELLVQNVCFQNLLRRNYHKEVEESRQSQNNYNAADAIHAETIEEKEKIPLPFIIMNSDSKAILQCEMCPSRTDVSLEFSLPFEINDDNEILKQLGMNQTTKETLQRSLPPDIYRYCYNKGLLESVASQSR